MFSHPLFHLSFYWQSETFAEESNKVGFFRSSFLIKFLKNRLEMFKVRGPVLYLILLKLRVTFDLNPGRIDKSLRVTKILFKKSLEIDPGWGSYLNPTFMLVLAETDLPTKKRGSKWGAVWPSGASGIEIILALLAEVVAFYIWLCVIEIWKSCL